ncbi:MAG: sn-glycerol-3-phosphate ABC transporter ATP-binding protein UgpC [Alphaproteobacteria bacterium]|nr:sn-glycerol-3-phosphate ABC transporter ATP-binding protein UgpC [Alphaproteobacteria bacterium]
MATVSLQKVTKSFGALDVIKGVNLDIADKEFVVFVGPSGCGKSTLLRMIAGLEDISAGTVSIDGDVVNDLPPAKREISMVFQSYALYPHKTVRENMGFGLRMAKMDKAVIDRKVNEAAKVLELESLLDRKPKQLSGGQRQRVAIGRAIVRQPRLFLFDEPLSNLDAALRGQMRIEIARLHQSLKATMIYVTHDQVEAMTLADKIVVLNAGRIEQVGSPLELYERPQNLFVAGFIGSPKMNFLKGEVLGVEGNQIHVGIGHGINFSYPLSGTPKVAACTKVTVGIRPEDFSSGAGEISIPVEAIVVEHLGAETHVLSSLGSSENLTAVLEGRSPVKVGDRFTVSAPINRVHIFDDRGLAIESPLRSPAAH